MSRLFGLVLLVNVLSMMACRTTAAPVSDSLGVTFNDEVIRAVGKGEKSLKLGTGVWLTDGKKNHRMAIAGDRLTISGKGIDSTIIRRPENSLGTGSGKDFYFGAFFEPAMPTDAELNSSEWKEWVDKDGSTFLYTVLIKGNLTIENLTIDCNMQAQSIQPGDKVEHSAMLGFAGSRELLEGRFAGRRVYVAFENVTVRNVAIRNEGYADGIWISRGYFQPNIASIHFDKVTTVNRVSTKRGSITFSSPAERVEISNCSLHRLELEESTQENYANAPRHQPESQLSIWTVYDSEVAILDMAAKGYSTVIQGENVQVKENVALYQMQGQFTHCTFNKVGDPRLFRLKEMIFDDVTWIFSPDKEGRIRGIRPTPQYGENFTATFINNKFLAHGTFLKGQLISSEYSRAIDQKVNVSFIFCDFDDRFGVIPNTIGVSVKERGSWKFEGLDEASVLRLIRKGPQTDIEVKMVNQ
ncbi:hypothetical protein GGR28_002866 [Lewinella aquimaris]|uniref:Uncharacterized protein n=1 Tax=Neolewinella aquimaris TaxID=1835722 RepID=A0A840EH51_9BACT|nr:hypothetical protein [Neolewinella aquimaris]MBB4080236.1 hypothetical protein [Neolewinella aquimaris]